VGITADRSCSTALGRLVARVRNLPELEAEKVADRIIDRIGDPEIALITANFANMDVLGHLEDDDAAIRAVETVDRCVGRVVEAAGAGGVDVLITADHGTVEKRLYPEGTKDTGHTDSPVPLIYIAADGAEGVSCRPEGALTDVAPTALALLGLEQPAEMTGANLLSGVPEKKGRRLLLVIADGWGYREETEGNLVAAAKTPQMDRFLAERPYGLLAAAGEAVGLPEGTVGNSEAGHLHIGAGRVVYSDRLRIDKAIADGSYRKNEAFLWAMDGAAKNGRTLHLLGIVSFFSSHGSLDHLMDLLEMAKERGVEKVRVHSLLGRRGERPEAGAAYIEAVDDKCRELGIGAVCTVTGRYWALDREENWDRVEKAYRAIAFGDGRTVPQA